LSSQSRLDLAFFQQLLANAFTVQECGMDRQSLASIVELQRSIQDGHLEEQGSMQLIAERARAVAHASGVAIGLLTRDHLFYAAGTGTAMSYVGMRVKATLTVSRNSDSKAEILRVENAEVDQRIEAAVCRQFRAKSLLILPFYRGRALAGVLHVLFDEPHTFQDQEMRTYRILAGLLSEALFQSVSPEQQKIASTRMNAARALIEQKVTSERRLSMDGATASSVISSDVPVVPGGEGAEFAAVGSTALVTTTEVASAIWLFWQRYLPLFRRSRIPELAVATVVAVFAWVLCTQRPATGSSAALSSKTPVGVPQLPTAPQVATPVDGTSTTVVPAVGDASLRDLAPAATKYRVRPNVRVKRFSDDVTMRYLPSKTTAVRNGDGVEIRQLSDDVTVRYIRPRAAVVKQDVESGTPAVQ
jgi:hypothetical protein